LKQKLEITATRTPRLNLRMINSGDFEEWRLLKSEIEPKVRFDKSDFKKHLKREALQRAADIRGEVGIFDRVSGRLMGFVDIKTVNRSPYQVCDVGYLLLKEFRGHGFATEATKALIPKIFRQLKFHRLEFAIEAENIASLKVAKALGLYDEGVRKHYWPTNYPKKSKVWSDQQIYVATPELFRG